MKIFTYFSEVLHKDCIACDNKYVGRLYDLVMKINEEIYPKATDLIIEKGRLKKRFCQVSWEDIEEIDTTIRLKIDSRRLNFSNSPPKHDLTLCIDILDQQVVDTHNQKTVRVNDIHLLRVDHTLYLAHVDVSLRGLVRRLGWERLIDFLVKIINKNSAYLKEELISWKHTQPLSIGRSKNMLRLDVARQKLASIPPTELKEIILDLDRVQRFSLFKSLDIIQKQEVFSQLPLEIQEDLLDKLEDKESAVILENSPPDEAADFLLHLPKEKVLKLLNLMETNKSKKLSTLLGYSSNSAGGLMTTEFISIHKDALVEEALKKIKESSGQAETIYYIYIIDEQNHLLATTSIRRIIAANPQSPIWEARFLKHIYVYTDDSVKEVAYLMDKYKCSAMPVVNKEKVIQGVITVDDVLSEVVPLAWRRYRKKIK